MAKEAKKMAEVDLLRGASEICRFLGISESTLMSWRKRFDEFPVIENGQLESSRAALNKWNANRFGV